MDGAKIYGICVLACLVSPIFTDVSQQGVNPGNPKVVVGRTDGFPNNYNLNNPVLTQNQAIDERNNQVLLQNNANDDVSLMHNYRHNDKVSQETLTANGPGFAASLARSTAGNVPDVGLPYSTMNQQYVQTSQEDSRSAQADLEAEAMVLANMGLQSSRTGFYPISVGPYYSGGSSASAQAAAQAAAQSQLGLPYMTPGYPSSAYGSAVANANALAAGQANANAQALANSGLRIEIPRPIIQPLPFYPSGASSNAEASAISNAISGGGMFPYGAESYQGGSSASATAQAIADAGGVIGYPYNSVYPLQNGANAIAEAEANAIANAGKNLLQPTMYSKILQGRIVPGIAGSLAEAEASANANAVGYAPIAIGPQIYPGAGSNAYAQTEANAISNGGYMQVVPASQPVFYPTYGPAGTSAGASALVDANTYSSGVSSATANALANAYGGGLGYSNGYANAQAQALSLAQAQALAQAQSVAQAQALAKASANAQAAALSAIKSADPEDGDNNDRK